MSANWTVLPYGPTAVMLEVDDSMAAAALAAHLRQLRSAGRIRVDEVVPAARSVLVRCSTPAQLADVVELAGGFDPAVPSIDDSTIVEVPVRYDGPDLGDIAAASGLSTDEVIRRHSEATYVAAFSGFAPGFSYLVGLDPVLHVPRRPSPRPHVPAGSVAIAGEFTGVYPTASPGGWHLLGSTAVVLWDIHRREPALIPPGRRVRFVQRAAR